MKKYFILIVALVIALAVNAQQRTAEDAMKIAKEFALSQQSTVNGRIKKAPRMTLAYTAKKNSEVHYYVFNSEGGGWTIVAGDGVAIDVLGSSDTGVFDYNNAPENLKWWLSQYEEQIAAAISAESSLTAKPQNLKTSKPKHASFSKSISPLIQTQWGQSDPFNRMCPMTAGQRCITGCVATAMAQIMNFWEWPKKGLGTRTYYDSKCGQELTANYREHEYDWNYMRDTYFEGSFSEREGNAVAQLMSDCGIGADMKYSPSGSGTGSIPAACALIRNFGYSSDVTAIQRNGYSSDDWAAIVYNELANGRPMMYSGQDASEGGHEFICDGYRRTDDTFHFNWGWTGSGDGYFALSAVAPFSYDFAYDQDIIVNIKPESVDAIELDRFTPYKLKLADTNLYLSLDELANDEIVTLSTTGTPLYFRTEGCNLFTMNTKANGTGRYLAAGPVEVGQDYPYVMTTPGVAEHYWKLEQGSVAGLYTLTQYERGIGIGYYPDGCIGFDAYYAGFPAYALFPKGYADSFILEPCTVPVLLGDVNDDSVVNVTDVVDLNQHLLDGKVGDLNPAVADINKDGVVNITDVVELVGKILK